MALTWKEQLLASLSKLKKGNSLTKKYGHAFSASYAEDYPVDIAIADIHEMEKLSDKNPLEINLYYSPDKAQLHLRFYQWDKPLPLSDILPMLENLDLRTDTERPYKVCLDDNHCIWVSDFSVIYQGKPIDVNKVDQLFQDAFSHVYFGLSENDGFNKLVLSAQLSWREITVLRMYAKYLRQIGFRFTQPYIESALNNNTGIAKNLVAYFLQMHDPATKQDPKQIEQIEKNILDALDNVTSLDEDRIIRRLLDLMKATLRTNYFQTTTDGKLKDYVSIKLNSRTIPELPLPMPLYEVFVYSTRFEAIHLRNTKVARGGIRWSDRREDFRTEILGLMKAQVVKNSVIVPSGAKGGFVLKAATALTDREALKKEVIFCYSSFIRGLLDITDNFVDNQYVHPKEVVCYDDADPYLVVAADKGTASFSDLANSISIEYGFWLNDAFASGGSTGYDHKKMGITARGAWESIKRHFRELNIDVMNTDTTTIGIGDMSGDVFGNGMIYSKHIKLIAAFDHRDIFIDPTPDPEISFYERKRLFDLPTSSWQDYNAKLISKGGGVYKRSLKSIKLSPQAKKVLGTEQEDFTPNELIRTILQAPVDLFYNGGIGTYVKSSTETNSDVGDRTNDYCRVNGNQLRATVVGEGGNLGFTQLGRVEYALKGGLINTDFIDNSAGVDCSDHEVNLKILLDREVQIGNLTETKRNELLASMTDEVAHLVLNDNYQQALVLSFSATRAVRYINLYSEYTRELENLGILNRKVEFLPDEKEMVERKSLGQGLTRPELAVLLAYTKIYIKHEILKTDLPEDPYLRQLVVTAFPETIRKKYYAPISEHRLHRDIIATQLSNLIVNEMGITFIYRLQTETGARIEDIIRAYVISSHIYDTQSLQKLILSLDFKISTQDQYEMLHHIRNLLNLSTRWFLHSRYLKEDLAKTIEAYSSRIKILEKRIPYLMSGETKKYLDSLTEQFHNAGFSQEIAQRIAAYRAIYTALNIIEVATRNNFDLNMAAEVYFSAGERLNLVWFRDQIATDSRDGHWNILSRLTLRDELDISQRAVTVAMMNHDKKEKDSHVVVAKWLQANQRGLERWEKLLTMLHTSSNVEYTMFFIAIRELMGIIVSSQ